MYSNCCNPNNLLLPTVNNWFVWFRKGRFSSDSRRIPVGFLHRYRQSMCCKCTIDKHGCWDKKYFHIRPILKVFIFTGWNISMHTAVIFSFSFAEFIKICSFVHGRKKRDYSLIMEYILLEKRLNVINRWISFMAYQPYMI